MSRRDAILVPAVSSIATAAPQPQPFVYSKDWSGSLLSPMSLEDAVQLSKDSSWPMARWPDPILRRAASDIDSRYFGTSTLRKACDMLRRTAIKEKAVGLAAEQCGVDARIIYLQDSRDGSLLLSPSALTMVNPHIVRRSPEMDMRVWTEHCLVLPPDFSATLMRDAWVEVEFQEPASGAWERMRLNGEPARAFQHEFDHDRGILITDHIGLEDMNTMMGAIERRGHTERMTVAYSRHVDEHRSSIVHDVDDELGNPSTARVRNKSQ